MRLRAVVIALAFMAVGTSCADSTAPSSTGTLELTVIRGGLVASVARLSAHIVQSNGAALDRDMSFSPNATSASLSQSVVAGATQVTVTAFSSAGTAIYRSVPASVDVSAGQTTSALITLVCINSACDPTVGASTLQMIAFAPEVESSVAHDSRTNAQVLAAFTPTALPTITVSGVSGRTNTSTEADYFRFSAVGGTRVDLATLAHRAGASDASDTVIELLDASGNVLAVNDDCGESTDSCINSHAVSVTGNYFARVTGYSGSVGRYTLMIVRRP